MYLNSDTAKAYAQNRACIEVEIDRFLLYPPLIIALQSEADGKL